MFREYAVDPNVCSRNETCLHFFSSFSQSAGRLINKVPGDWERKAIYALNKASFLEDAPVDKARYKNKVKKIAKEVLLDDGSGIRFNEEEDWLSKIQRSERLNEFAAVIGLSNDQDIRNLHSFEDLILNHPELWEVPNEEIVSRNAADIVDVLEPLLKVSKEIVIVDPYFRADRRFIQTTREIISRREVYNFSRGIKNIRINCEPPTVGENFEGFQHWLTTEFQQYLPQGFEMEIKLWREKYLHDRWLLTNIGGLRIPIGFDEGKWDDDREAEISRLSNDARKKWLSRVSGSQEKPLHRFTISAPE
tara:strand:- start:107 stop:1024 length:918 start_codon:yes stop_codon:yes gene_type:complete